jgi:MFS family permease
VILVVLILSIVAMLLCAWAPSFDIFTVSYFFTGFFLFGYETTVYIYISEISAVRFKTISINMLTMVWAGTPMFLVLLRYIPTWRYSFCLFALIWLGTLPFAYFCFLESPRFLLSKKCYSQVREIFEKISITNKRPPYKYRLIEEIDVENEEFLKFKEEDERENSKDNWLGVKQYNYLDLFRYGSVKKATFFLMYFWMFRFFMYFALNLALESVLQSGSILTIAISTSSFFEVIGTFGILILTFMFKKKYTLL